MPFVNHLIDFGQETKPMFLRIYNNCNGCIRIKKKLLEYINEDVFIKSNTIEMVATVLVCLCYF